MAFRVLHIADLHLGQRFHDQDRGAEEQHALDQLVRLCQAEAVDVVLIAGDVFDTANPGAAETARWHGFLARLVLEVGVGTVVLIAGNHDSGGRIEGPRELYAACRIVSIGHLRLDDPIEKVLVPLHAADGRRLGTCIALPYLRDADVRAPAAGEDAITAASNHAAAVAERARGLHAAVDRAPLLVMAHAFCSGGHLSGDERPVQIGNLGQIPADALAGGAAYLALGHLHRPQIVGGQEHWRYSGSLLPTGFDEIAREHGCILAEVPEQGPARVRFHTLAPYRRYADLIGPEIDLVRQLAGLRPPGMDEPTPWLRVRVQAEQPSPALAQHLLDLATERGWQLLAVQMLPRQASRYEGSVETQTADTNLLDDPQAVFARLMDDNNIVEGREALQRAFARLLETHEELL